MEIKAILNKPFSNEEKMNFIVENNHKLGFLIKENDVKLEAWGLEDEELILKLKEEKKKENIQKAKKAIENGFVVFKEAEFETNAQTVGDLTASMLLIKEANLEKYSWLTKDDKIVELTIEDFGVLGNLIAEFKNKVWNELYLSYKEKIENAKTQEELDEIVIGY